MNKQIKLKVFLVDDDALFLRHQEIEINRQNEYNVQTFATGEQCIEHLSESPDVVIVDYWLNGIKKDAMNGQQVLNKVKRFNSDIEVVILSEQKKIEVAVDCMQHRAFNYVVKSKTACKQLHSILHKIKLMTII